MKTNRNEMRNVKKNADRMLAVLIVLVAMMMALRPMEVSAKAAVTTNVKGTYSMKKAATKTLYVRNAGKVTWKSAKTSVATVSSAGKVTAKAAGSAKITAKASGKTYSCTIKVTAPAAKAAASKAPAQNLGLNTTGMAAADAAIFRKMYALRTTLREGMRWTSANYYRWNGGIFAGGYGCSAFAFRLSDAAFGKTPAKRHYNFNNVKVGDILRINYNSHSVVVLKVVGNQFVVAEGNYNSSVHWGRVLTRAAARATGTYVMTRR